jgi:hypothetical protein
MTMVKKPARYILITVLFIPIAANAQDWFVSPFAGATFRTETGFVDLENAAEKTKLALGVGVGRWGTRALGFEGEVTWVPGIFNGEEGLVLSSHLLAVTGNVLVALPRTRHWIVKPYATAGAGAMFIRTEDIADVFTSSSILKTLDAGAGAMIPMKKWTWRLDFRYFLSEHAQPKSAIPVIDDRSLRFWRASGGVLVRF